jgi:hypothetical protein
MVMSPESSELEYWLPIEMEGGADRQEDACSTTEDGPRPRHQTALTGQGGGGEHVHPGGWTPQIRV